MQIPSTLTVKQIKEIARLCNISLRSKLKKDLLSELNSQKISERILKPILADMQSKTKSKKSQRSKKQPSTIKGKRKESAELKIMHESIMEMKNQIRFLFSKVDMLEKTMNLSGAKFSNASKSIRNRSIPTNLGTIRANLKNLIKIGESSTIDEILEHDSMQKFSKNSIKKVISDLIDEEVFDCAEGNSKEKVDGEIGLIIRI